MHNGMDSYLAICLLAQSRGGELSMWSSCQLALETNRQGYFARRMRQIQSSSGHNLAVVMAALPSDGEA